MLSLPVQGHFLQAQAHSEHSPGGGLAASPPCLPSAANGAATKFFHLEDATSQRPDEGFSYLFICTPVYASVHPFIPLSIRPLRPSSSHPSLPTHPSTTHFLAP